MPTVRMRVTPAALGGRDELGVGRLAQVQMGVRVDHAPGARPALLPVSAGV